MTDWLDRFWVMLAVVLAGAAFVALAWITQQIPTESPRRRTTPQEEEEPDWLEAILLLELLDDDFDGDDFEGDDLDDDLDDDYGYG
jgi:hypothetical protein